MEKQQIQNQKLKTIKRVESNKSVNSIVISKFDLYRVHSPVHYVILLYKDGN